MLLDPLWDLGRKLRLWPAPAQVYMPTEPRADNARPILGVGTHIVHSDVPQALNVMIAGNGCVNLQFLQTVEEISPSFLSHRVPGAQL